MNESSLTKVHRRRLPTQVNPCIPTNVAPKTATPDQNGPSPSGRLRLLLRKPYADNLNWARMSKLNFVAAMTGWSGLKAILVPVCFGALPAQWTNSNPSFGHLVQGYAHYFGTAYTDYVIGDYMTEAVFPRILHQDPRCFRPGMGSGWSRLGCGAGQIVADCASKPGTQPGVEDPQEIPARSRTEVFMQTQIKTSNG
jgi:hypothetical protein